MSKQDRQGVRKASDVELKYNLGRIASAQGATAKQALALQQLAQTLSQYMTDNSADLDEINKRIDGVEKTPGEPGFSPLIDVTKIEGGYRITITDVDGAETFDIMDGKNATVGDIEDDFYPGCYYRFVDDEKEWVNPPMIKGEEYRTTERFGGSPVYTQVIDFGALPSNSTKKLSIGISSDKVISVEALICSDKYATMLPYLNSSKTLAARYYIDRVCDFVVNTYEDASAYSATITLKYIK